MNIQAIKDALEHAPEGQPSPKGLVGFSDGNGFICEKCAGRLVARNCGGLLARTFPVWEWTSRKCEACGVTPLKGG